MKSILNRIKLSLISFFCLNLCGANAQSIAPTPTDLVVLFSKKESALELYRNLDGESVLSEKALNQLEQYKNLTFCTALYTEDFKDVLGVISDRVIKEQIRSTFDMVGGKYAKKLTEKPFQSCSVKLNDGTVSLAGYEVDIAVVQWSIFEFIDYKHFEPLILFTTDEFNDAKKKFELQVEKENKITQQNVELFEKFSKDSVKSHVGSITVQYPEPYQEVLLCTLAVSGDEAVPILEYLIYQTDLIFSYTFEEALLGVENRRVSDGNPYNVVFTDLEDFYKEWQTNQEICDVFVGFPADLKRFVSAAPNINPNFQYELNRLVAVDELNDNWAVRLGWSSWTQIQFANKVGANMESIAALEEFGIKNFESFATKVENMNSSGYAAGDDISNVLAFLQDEQIAEQKQTTALSIKNEREEKKRVEEQKRIEKRRNQIAALKRYLDLTDYEFRVFEASNVISVDRYEEVKKEMESSAFGDYISENYAVFRNASIKNRVQQYLRIGQFARLHNSDWYEYFSKEITWFFPNKYGDVNGGGRYYLSYVSEPYVHSSGQMVKDCRYENGEEFPIGANLKYCTAYVFRP